MASESRASEEPYTHHFMTTVESVDGTRVTLEETYFYPEGGGQPADKGVIDGVRVTDVQTVDETVVHHVEKPPSFGAGDFVSASVDDDFRRYCMRAHTASHALYGAGRRLFEGLGYGGFDIGPEKVRVDLETAEPIEDDDLIELERLVNRVVWEDRPVRWEEVPSEQALSREDVAFNVATRAGVEDAETVRLVEIEEWDVAACGGTHVRATSEIGPVTVLSRSNPGEGQTRVTFTVGPGAIQHRASERRAAMAAARTLDSTRTDLDDAVAELREERDTARAAYDDLLDDYVARQIAGLREDIVEVDGETWLVGSIDGLGANDLADRSQSLAGDAADMVVLVSSDGSALAVATDGDASATALVERATDAFGGGGGGSNTVAQGGGLDASVNEIVDLYP